MQGSSRVATGCAGQISCIVTCGCNSLTIPGISQLSFTNGDGLFTGYNSGNNYMQGSSRVATGCAGQISCIVTCGCNTLIIRCVWQLSFTNGDGLFTGYNRVNN